MTAAWRSQKPRKYNKRDNQAVEFWKITLKPQMIKQQREWVTSFRWTDTRLHFKMSAMTAVWHLLRGNNLWWTRSPLQGNLIYLMQTSEIVMWIITTTKEVKPSILERAWTQQVDLVDRLLYMNLFGKRHWCRWLRKRRSLLRLQGISQWITVTFQSKSFHQRQMLKWMTLHKYKLIQTTESQAVRVVRRDRLSSTIVLKTSWIRLCIHLKKSRV